MSSAGIPASVVRGWPAPRQGAADCVTVSGTGSWGPWQQKTRPQLRTILFTYIEVLYNRSRHQAGLGHSALAERIGVSTRTLRRLLAGRAPAAPTRIRITDALRGLPREDGAADHERLCEACGVPFTSAHPRQKLCSSACRKRAHRQRKAATACHRAGQLAQPQSSSKAWERPLGSSSQVDWSAVRS